MQQHRDLAQPRCLLAQDGGFFSPYITPSLVRCTLQTADCLMCCCCFDFETLGPLSQLAQTEKGQTTNADNLKDAGNKGHICVFKDTDDEGRIADML